MISGAAIAQETKSNPNLFRHCSDIYNDYSVYLNRQRDDFIDEINTHADEVGCLDEIRKFMRNGDEVWSKRDRAYRKYSRAYDEYESFNVGDKQEREAFERIAGCSNSEGEKPNARCFGSRSRNTLDQFCDTGESRYQAFCSTFK
ncbi:hypothetical protein SAMN05444000_1238 [Shimia gijangensis]|uniref:Uncharacterized protein n=1 Tax=Shimia gijangensis TaxID=1470563 RepID=A0A1M6QTJ9_9RHOB|nr:hypothetical protein [Shimia gijangensis]SHK23357.1 hypothetical protein SAMN05444000_1238 [Shimia gijangensis]